MYLTVIAWIYVVLLMSIAEATSSTGTVLGAIMTFLLYGVLPLSVVMYLMGTPARRRAIKAREMQEMQETQEKQAAQAKTQLGAAEPHSGEPNASRHAAGAAHAHANANDGAPVGAHGATPAVREKP